jgi:glycyl-tRNA synthetase alpha subunit
MKDQTAVEWLFSQLMEMKDEQMTTNELMNVYGSALIMEEEQMSNFNLTYNKKPMKAKINPILRFVELTYGVETKTIQFDDLDEWYTIEFAEGKFDVHFDYMQKHEFTNEKEWLTYIIQAYPYNNDVDYEYQVIKQIELEL